MLRHLYTHGTYVTRFTQALGDGCHPAASYTEQDLGKRLLGGAP